MNGLLCATEVMTEMGECNTQACEEKVDCAMTEWTDWDACSCECNGIQHRNRHVSVYPKFGGTMCEGHLREIQGCHEQRCKLDEEEDEKKEDKRETSCELGPWTEWTSCSVSCDGGMTVRQRTVKTPQDEFGNPCEGPTEVVEGCAPEPCGSDKNLRKSGGLEPQDCRFSEWDEWGECSVSCGGGEQFRSRQLDQVPNKTGRECTQNGLLELRECNQQGCSCRDCEWGEWQSWGVCTCTGLQQRHRVIETHFSTCGRPCEGVKVENKVCEPDCIKEAVNCEMSEWGEWKGCDVTCGGGATRRERTLIKESANGGALCEGSLSETVACGTESCDNALDCKLSEWGDWGGCSDTCDGGQQSRTRNILSSSEDGGTGCTADLVEVQGCNEQTCGDSQDCEWGDWTEWGACTASCGGGHQERDRSVKIAPRFSGALCDAKAKGQMQQCNTQECDKGCIDAKWGPWHEWGDCSAKCGETYRFRSREIEQRANHCGANVIGDVQEYEPCEYVKCEEKTIDCQFSEWEDWEDCSCSCNGVQDRSRRVAVYNQNGGKHCSGALKMLRPCNVDMCDVGEKVDCVFGGWSEWSGCNAKCDGGTRTRHREVITPSANGGIPCEGGLVYLGPCNNQGCHYEVNCQWGQWSAWGECSHECGGGESSRYRHIMQLPSPTGRPCAKGASSEIQRCNEQQCGVLHFCSWAGWEDWGQCSDECGTGHRKRSRVLLMSTEKPNSDDSLVFSAIIKENEQLTGEPDVAHRMESVLVQAVSVFVAGILFASGALILVSRLRSSLRGRSEPLEFELLPRE